MTNQEQVQHQNFPNKEQSGLLISTPGINSAITSIHQYFLALVLVPTTNEKLRHLNTSTWSLGEKRLLRSANFNHLSKDSTKQFWDNYPINSKVLTPLGFVLQVSLSLGDLVDKRFNYLGSSHRKDMTHSINAIIIHMYSQKRVTASNYF